MSADHGHENPYDSVTGFHPSCVTDPQRPEFDAEWQRRAFGLAVALSEFGHYPWAEFQQHLIATIGQWERTPSGARDRWAYYEHWVGALLALAAHTGLIEPGELAQLAPTR